MVASNPGLHTCSFCSRGKKRVCKKKNEKEVYMASRLVNKVLNYLTITEYVYQSIERECEGY